MITASPIAPPPIALFDCRLDDSAIAAAHNAFVSGALASGPAVPAFETELAAWLDAEQITAVSDLSHAMQLALRLAGVGAGDDVLTVAFNCLSSTVAIAQVGARPVWVDVDPVHATMCVADAERAITPRTKALVSYHIAGYPADIVALNALCARHGIKHIIDANTALGSRINGHPVGTAGDFGVFSFYPNRQIGSVEGAALFCKDPADGAHARRLRRFGIEATRFRDGDGEIAPGEDVAELGLSAALSNVNAAIARSRLPTLDARIAATRANVTVLSDLTKLAATTPVRLIAGHDPAYWTWLVTCDARDALMRSLKARGVNCSKLHQPNDIYSGFSASARPLPGTRALEATMLALPCGWWLGGDDLTRIAGAVMSDTVMSDAG
jgi:perosamine synthetase